MPLPLKQPIKPAKVYSAHWWPFYPSNRFVHWMECFLPVFSYVNIEWESEWTNSTWTTSIEKKRIIVNYISNPFLSIDLATWFDWVFLHLEQLFINFTLMMNNFGWFIYLDQWALLLHRSAQICFNFELLGMHSQNAGRKWWNLSTAFFWFL